MIRYSTLWASLLLLFVGGCSTKQYTVTETKVITLKTPKIRFNDVGYIRSDGERLYQVDLFNAGQEVERFEIGRLICVTDGCMSKHVFNEEYLNSAYPDGLLANVLLGKRIFEGKGLKESDDGFEQSFQDTRVDITYRVDEKEIYFKDRKNAILIRVKSVK